MQEGRFACKKTLLLNADQKAITRAAAIIRKGGLVAFPTETVYGLGAAADHNAALEKIFIAKGRPADNPLIVHIASKEQLFLIASTVPPEALKLAARFWPGPLSLVLPRSDLVSPLVSAGLDTVAIRMPDHPVALALIREAGRPIAAPSANRSGRPSPTTYRHVLEDLGGRIDAVMRSEPCKIGLESTVIDLSGPVPIILRPGGVPREAIEAVLGRQVLIAGHDNQHQAPRSPGMKYRHYAPRAPLILITGSESRRRKLITVLQAYYANRGLKIALLSTGQAAPSGGGHQAARVIAARLYAGLRKLDHQGADLIIAEETGLQGLGLAVMNRLRKAAVRVLRT